MSARSKTIARLIKVSFPESDWEQFSFLVSLFLPAFVQGAELQQERAYAHGNALATSKTPMPFIITRMKPWEMERL